MGPDGPEVKEQARGCARCPPEIDPRAQRGIQMARPDDCREGPGDPRGHRLRVPIRSSWVPAGIRESGMATSAGRHLYRVLRRRGHRGRAAHRREETASRLMERCHIREAAARDGGRGRSGRRETNTPPSPGITPDKLRLVASLRNRRRNTKEPAAQAQDKTRYPARLRHTPSAEAWKIIKKETGQGDNTPPTTEGPQGRCRPAKCTKMNTGTD